MLITFRMAEYLRSVINKLFYSSPGQLIVSAIFGLAIALLFKRVCKDNCTMYYAPYIDEIKGQTFKLEDTCYEYAPYVVDCNKSMKEPLVPYDVNTEPTNMIAKIKSNIMDN